MSLLCKRYDTLRVVMILLCKSYDMLVRFSKRDGVAHNLTESTITMRKHLIVCPTGKHN